MPKIPRVMSTQHPDNVRLPFFAESPDMSGENEIKEAYYAFSHLGCEEQMWDCEGKEVDAFDFKIDYEHKKVTSRIIKAIKEDNSDLQSMIEEAAYLRWVLQIEVSAWPDGVSA